LPLRLDCVCIRAFGALCGFQFINVKARLKTFLAAR
jgi:hypothetical protein